MRTDFVYITAVFCLALLYITESCNVEIVATGKPTKITSPGYGKSLYPNNLTCWWRVVAANNDSNVVVNVVHSRIESTVNCAFDNVTFYDGFNTSSPRIATICGSQTETYVSTNNSVYIQFKTDFSDRFEGFKLKVYEKPKCVYHLTASSNSTFLTSPGYPKQYFNNMRCTWVISAENENDTVVLVADRLQLVNSFHCFDDYVTVFNGNTTNANNTLGTFCGGSSPSFQSSKNQVTIQFITNGSAVSTGFYMHYKSVKADDCNRTMHADTNILYIVPPGYPDGIQNDLVCVWTIFSRTSQVLYSGLSTFGELNDCGNDSLTVYSGYGSVKLGSFCGNSTGLYKSSTSVMTIVFKSGETIGMDGFKIAYVTSNAQTWIPRIPNWFPDLTNWNSYVPNFDYNPVDTNWNSDWDDGNDDNTYYYSYTGYGIGGGVGVFVIIIAGGTARARSKRSRTTATRARRNRQGIDNVVAVSVDTGSKSAPAVFQPPPPYCEVVKTEQSRAVGTKTVTPQ